MDFSGITLGELIVAAASTLGIGLLWYSDFFFGKRWRSLALVQEGHWHGGRRVLLIVGVFLLHFLIALFLSVFTEIAMMIGSNALYAALMGALLCIGFVATTFGINYLFARKPLKLYLIDVGYLLISFTVMGLIIGAWY